MELPAEERTSSHLEATGANYIVFSRTPLYCYLICPVIVDVKASVYLACRYPCAIITDRQPCYTPFITETSLLSTGYTVKSYGPMDDGIVAFAVFNFP